MTAAALGLTLETALFVLVGMLYLIGRGYTIAEAGAVAIVSVLMGLSLIHQVDFFTGTLVPGLVFELIALIVGLVGLFRRRPPLRKVLASVVDTMRRDPFPAVILAVAFTGMAAWMVGGWLLCGNSPAVNFRGDGMVGWGSLGLPRLTDARPIAPLNAAALFFHTARFGMGPGACGVGLLALLAMAFSTYALARRYAWPPMALTVTLMVVSTPRLVFLGINPSAEIIASTAIAVSMVLLYRLVEQHQAWDLRLFTLCLLFSIHAHPMSVALVLVMTLLLLIVMVRRHGWIQLRELIVDNPPSTAAVLLLAVGLAQIPVFALNLSSGNPPFGAVIAFDTDGIIGAVANLFRYLFVSIDPTEPVRKALVWLVGLDLKRLLMGLYNASVVALFGQSGANAPFVPVFSGSGPAGFGPLAPLLALPAMVYAVVRGPRRLKAVSVAWVGYLYLAALVLAWTPENLVVLSPLYAASGFVVAFSLPPWRLRRRGMRILQVLCAILLIGAFAWGRPLPF